ncbi:hypothetical protein M422DRAFT_261484 [Sphaerobolus stellatus SS14]|uniref:Uncharacterized protein n=1 Tax=Sphaerobolus stellatus (strain SS14) TaxID=990650 RepID=A0A0C9VFG1_SPHS4|nr:hypothetical protein M422DRAFT_261484 [Sphaerobolus stellatus SS14]
MSAVIDELNNSTDVNVDGAVDTCDDTPLSNILEPDDFRDSLFWRTEGQTVVLVHSSDSYRHAMLTILCRPVAPCGFRTCAIGGQTYPSAIPATSSRTRDYDGMEQSTVRT